MYEKTAKRLWIICVLFITVACQVKTGNSVNQDRPMKDTLVFTGCQEKISAEVGSIVEIQLEAITGTGYQWILKQPSTVLQQLTPDVLKYSTPENKQNIPGGVSYQVLEFKALKTGQEVIQLEYKRTFEPQVEKSCVVKVEIK